MGSVRACDGILHPTNFEYDPKACPSFFIRKSIDPPADTTLNPNAPKVSEKSRFDNGLIRSLNKGMVGDCERPR